MAIPPQIYPELIPEPLSEKQKLELENLIKIIDKKLEKADSPDLVRVRISMECEIPECAVLFGVGPFYIKKGWYAILFDTEQAKLYESRLEGFWILDFYKKSHLVFGTKTSNWATTRK
ncbi:hypothetical protein ACFL0K_00690 [Patescibacteria group bacterium]